ncbi:hypothetical protein OCK72_11125 [Fusobacterium simiae]|uniref:Uncharacterized protein n=1 Tax=Fusobacterium simiae TaxID=855 RepID=A0ABT4DKN3_FUSSI|nr:hypothetical protein [Fusobacterium simiae]MCY7009174.1 hypothetical protein [Fusobacterium simiae]
MKKLDTLVEFEKEYMVKVDIFKNEKVLGEKEYSIMVSKSLITEELWQEIMDEKKIKDNKKKKVLNDIKEEELLEFCNRLSEKYGLNQIYKYKENEPFNIIDSTGNLVKLKDIDFKKLKGYRLMNSTEYIAIMINGDKNIEEELELENEITYDVNEEYRCFIKSKNKCNLSSLKDELSNKKVGFRIVRTI